MAEENQGMTKAQRRSWRWSYVVPAAAALLAFILDVCLPDAPTLVNVTAPHAIFRWLMLLAAVLSVVGAMRAYLSPAYRHRYLGRMDLASALLLVLGVWNVLTKKMALLPALYFPSFDMILSVYLSDWKVLLTCTAYSLRLLVLGVLSGGVVGFLTGVLIGWSKKAYHWLFPIIRFIGPIPTTIWIPIAMLLMPSLLHASVFIVALSMWFPLSFLTCSGIQGVRKSLFEVGETLGASQLYQVVHIAIPAAMPNIFVGLFMGMVSSLISLVSAELIGAKYGLGWYINWQQQVMNYAEVYAGFLIIALLCYVIFRVIFMVRNKVLVWKKGAIRW